MRKVIALCLVSTLLMGQAGPVGCSVTAQQARDIAAQSIDVICLGAPAAHTAFLSYTQVGNVAQGTIRKEAQAYAAVMAVCDSRPLTNTESAFRAINAAFTAVLDAQRAAKKELGI